MPTMLYPPPHTHNANHLFNCSQVPTQHQAALSKKPSQAAVVDQEWEFRLASLQS